MDVDDKHRDDDGEGDEDHDEEEVLSNQRDHLGDKYINNITPLKSTPITDSHCRANLNRTGLPFSCHMVISSTVPTTMADPVVQLNLAK